MKMSQEEKTCRKMAKEHGLKLHRSGEFWKITAEPEIIMPEIAVPAKKYGSLAKGITNLAWSLDPAVMYVSQHEHDTRGENNVICMFFAIRGLAEDLAEEYSLPVSPNETDMDEKVADWIGTVYGWDPFWYMATLLPQDMTFRDVEHIADMPANDAVEEFKKTTGKELIGRGTEFFEQGEVTEVYLWSIAERDLRRIVRLIQESIRTRRGDLAVVALDEKEEKFHFVSRQFNGISDGKSWEERVEQEKARRAEFLKTIGISEEEFRDAALRARG